jgi:hypothetical protein
MSTVNGTSAGGSGSPRAIWIVLFLIIGTFVGAAAGLLTYANDASVHVALLAAGGAFAGAVLFLVAIYEFLRKST